MTEADFIAIAWPGLLWDLGIHLIIGGTIGVILQRPRTAYLILALVCLVEAFLTAGLITLFAGTFLGMAVTENEPLWGTAGVVFAPSFLASLAVQGGPALFGAWLARRVFRRPQT